MKCIHKKDPKITWIIDLVSFETTEIPAGGKRLSPALATLSSVHLWAILVEM